MRDLLEGELQREVALEAWTSNRALVSRPINLRTSLGNRRCAPEPH